MPYTSKDEMVKFANQVNRSKSTEFALRSRMNVKIERKIFQIEDDNLRTTPFILKE